ncbi:hypothetical protein, partial [Rhodoblastus sp.]|uniref:hypothetical protein n=1 Tax=Rhodoblastus sp. TaxID=1962975 RepID=UPI003F96DCD7
FFPHKLAQGYDNPRAQVVKTVNGIPVKNLNHLLESLDRMSIIARRAAAFGSVREKRSERPPVRRIAICSGSDSPSRPSAWVRICFARELNCAALS